MTIIPFHGSYQPDDCQFLLTPIEAGFLSVEEKERRIQSGQAHYSEMIHQEQPPSAPYQQLFDTLCERYAERLAAEVQQLARQIVIAVGKSDTPIVLISLVRAGTPIGALLRRAIARYEDQPCQHFSMSIIRDRGLDDAALDYVLNDRNADAQRVVFVDAWTAKGVITRELRRDLGRYNARRQAQGQKTLPDRLAVISDIGGTADFAATYEDYAIPSGILNATVSGLVSRSILNHLVPDGAFHGCVVYDELAEHDQSQRFIERIAAHFSTAPRHPQRPTPEQQQHQQHLMTTMLDQIHRDYAVSDINHIKPGVAEATRVMLRRVPALLMVRDRAHPDVQHLLLLAEEKHVPVVECTDMPFHACSLIKALGRAESAS